MTSSEESVDDFNAFLSGKLQSLTDKYLKQLQGDESLLVEGIFC